MEEGLALAQKVGLPKTATFCWNGLGILALQRGDHAAAGEIEAAHAVIRPGKALLDRHRDSLEDPAWQRAFVENVPAHREIVAAHAKVQQARRAGQRTFELPAAAPGHRQLAPDQMVAVTWTLCASGDDEIAGKVARRHHRLLRLLREAEAQGAAPTYHDLAQALEVSQRTIQRDMRALSSKQDPDLPATRGRRG